jgi:hypothetical protein
MNKKYYESRVTNDPVQSEAYLKSVLRQCCLMSGIKGSYTIVYVKVEYHSHEILENLCTFIKTGIYPNLFAESEMCCIANETTPSIPSNKRVERTLLAFNNFANLIQERVHVVIGLESGLSSYKLSSLFREHSFLFTDLYIDMYKRLSLETLNSIAHYYLVLQIEENKARRLNMNKKYNPMEDEADEAVHLSTKETQAFSGVMVEIHQAAFEHYYRMYTKLKESGRVCMPKPFTVTMFKQIALFFQIYMKKIRDQEAIKIAKFANVFRKIDQVTHRLENFEEIRGELVGKIEQLDSSLAECDEKVSAQKEKYRQAANDCKIEEKLINDMSTALEQLRKEVNTDNHELKNMYTPQFEIALSALKSLNVQSFVELRSFRQPPQRVLAVINTLCLMFRQPPGWESGKLLLIREKFFDDLIYYDKKSIPIDIFDALEQICQVKS